MLQNSINKNRFPELDILRVIAILLILGRHIMVIPENAPYWLGSTVRLWKVFFFKRVSYF
jgi:peptidoglycan/LPS O-acetylase OafA/YrhL